MSRHPCRWGCGRTAAPRQGVSVPWAAGAAGQAASADLGERAQRDHVPPERVAAAVLPVLRSLGQTDAPSPDGPAPTACYSVLARHCSVTGCASSPANSLGAPWIQGRAACCPHSAPCWPDCRTDYELRLQHAEPSAYRQPSAPASLPTARGVACWRRSAHALVRAAGRRLFGSVRALPEIRQRDYERAADRPARGHRQSQVRYGPAKLADDSRSARNCRHSAARRRHCRTAPGALASAPRVMGRAPTAIGHRFREGLQGLVIRVRAAPRVPAHH